MPNVPVSISTLLFCQSRFPMVNKTNSGRTLSSLYEASACNQSLHLPAHRSLPPSPTSSNPFILLIYLPIYQSAHTDPIDPSFLLVSNFLHTHTHTAVSFPAPCFPHFFLFVFMRVQWTAALFGAPPCFIFIRLHSHTWELPSSTTAVSAGAVED